MERSMKVKTEIQKRNPWATPARALNGSPRIGALTAEKAWSPVCVPEPSTAPVRGEIRHHRAAACKGDAGSSHPPDLPRFHHLPPPPGLRPLGPLLLSEDVGLRDESNEHETKKDRAKVSEIIAPLWIAAEPGIPTSEGYKTANRRS